MVYRSDTLAGEHGLASGSGMRHLSTVVVRQRFKLLSVPFHPVIHTEQQVNAI